LVKKKFLYRLNPTSIEMHFQLEIRIQVFVVFSFETMEATSKGMEAHGAGLYYSWCFSLPSQDIQFSHCQFKFPTALLPLW